MELQALLHIKQIKIKKKIQRFYTLFKANFKNKSHSWTNRSSFFFSFHPDLYQQKEMQGLRKCFLFLFDRRDSDIISTEKWVQVLSTSEKWVKQKYCWTLRDESVELLFILAKTFKINCCKKYLESILNLQKDVFKSNRLNKNDWEIASCFSLMLRLQ